MKKLILFFAAVVPVLCVAQKTQSIDFFPEDDNVIITYNLTDDASTITVFLSENGGEWQQLNQVSGDVGSTVTAGDKRIVWNIYKEKPKGVSDNVRFAVVPNYQKPSLDNLPDGFSKYRTVIRGSKGYSAVKKNYKKQYAGDIRKGTWASATDNISYDVVIYEYDFITDEVKEIDSFSWSGRVARKGKPMGDFPVVEEPSHRMNIDKKGRVCIDKTVVVK